MFVCGSDGVADAEAADAGATDAEAADAEAADAEAAAATAPVPGLLSSADLEHVYICVLVHVLSFAAAAAIHGSGKCRRAAGHQWRDEADELPKLRGLRRPRSICEAAPLCELVPLWLP